MSQIKNINFRQENDLKKVTELLLRNYKLFSISLILAIGLAFFVNQYTIPLYHISSSLLIKEDTRQGGGTMNDYLNSNLFGKNLNFENELAIIQSSTVIEQTIKNLDLSVSYYQKKEFQYIDAYKNVPFRVIFSRNHVQPINIRFNISFQKGTKFVIKAESDEISFFDFEKNETKYQKENWKFQHNGEIGKLIETPDLSFFIEIDSAIKVTDKDASYSFIFRDLRTLTDIYKNQFQSVAKEKKATIISMSLNSESVNKGIDLLNEIMNVYSQQNLDRKNHIASMTIDYIEKQLGEVSDSLNQTENSLQRFRSSNQLLDVSQQANGLSTQFMDLQNKRAELSTRSRYYEDMAGYLSKSNDFSNMIVPAAMGIQDPLLNSLMSELITSQAQRSNLIENNQARNPLVKKLDIKIENLKQTITENINGARKTTSMTLDEMNKRIGQTQAQISRLPRTQQLLGGIERKYRLNDAIYNYLQEKRAEANITRASNLPDAIIIEPAMVLELVSPNQKKNYALAFLLGLGLPFSYLMIKKALNNKIEPGDNIEQSTDVPVLGKILHNNRKINNVMFEYPKSTIAESFRALRTNLDFYLRGEHHKVILVASCLEGEGKSFLAQNIAMSYAQMGRKTLLLDTDLRKPTNFFDNKDESQIGLSSYLINKDRLKDIIMNSSNEKLDYICSGPVPPNPAELLALDETKKLMLELKERYDYIIIDTPPLAQVTDGYLLMDEADTKIIVVRYKYSKKNILSTILKDLKHKKIENVCLVLNDNRVVRDQYGYGYGYHKGYKS